jgi:large subunit ribosomal protein L10
MVAVVETEKGKREVSLAKKLMLGEIEREFDSSSSAFFSRFNKLPVQDMNELRRTLEKFSRRTLLTKHTLTKKVLEKLNLLEASKFLEGSVLVTLGVQEPQTVSKALVEFLKGHENFTLLGMVLDGKIYEANFIKELAKLPSRKELLTQVAIRMKSPISGFVLTLGGLLRSFVTVLNEIQKKKKAQTAPPVSI